MGNYNPHAPYIIGEEWVPIRQADFLPERFVERGYELVIDHTTAIVSGAYFATFQGSRGAAQCINVYPAGTEDLSGPVHQVTIPVRAITATGTGSLVSDNTMFWSGGDAPEYGVTFAVGDYSQQLAGKRIVNMEIVYAAVGTAEGLRRASGQLERVLVPAGGVAYILSLSATGPFPDRDYAQMGDLNPFWASGITNVLTQGVNVRLYPWRYEELVNLDTSAVAALKLHIRFQCSLIGLPTDSLAIFVEGLRVTYCEEKRVLYGADWLTSDNNDNKFPVNSGKYVQLRTTSLALPTTTAGGRYLVTEHWQSFPPFVTSVAPVPPTLTALRQLYEVTPQHGVQMRQSTTVDGEFTSESSDVLPLVTLHTSSSVVTGSHAYGNRIAAPVYGGITAVQEIEDDPAGTSKVYPQVRFYARRFGETTQALRLVDVATGTFTASISVSDFDALPEIVDGWREVNLRFANAPSFATAAGDVDWRFDSVGEIASNQWQILGANSSTFTGGQSIAAATYYAPQGDTVTLTWQSPSISGTANDTLADVALIFSTDPMPVSGFGLAISNQSVTNALECDVLSGCIASAIQYVNLTWTAQTFLPVTGFGRYEVERYDSVDGAWTQIMTASSPSVTGFADYEARVGVLSYYRIRTCNVLDFCGPWVTGSATIPAPGVTISGDGNSMLIFTSNVQPTSNLAYVMQFEGKPSEVFVFGESDQVVFQRMFGRNFPIAFHPLEREGERFTRLILVNSAAIPLPSLGNFTGIRDLAWADLPCVTVRDELGNRWYANIRVPDGRVEADRTVYFAQVEITQVSETPCPVEL